MTNCTVENILNQWKRIHKAIVFVLSDPTISESEKVSREEQTDIPSKGALREFTM
jgi:hypothetical protein